VGKTQREQIKKGPVKNKKRRGPHDDCEKAWSSNDLATEKFEKALKIKSKPCYEKNLNAAKKNRCLEGGKISSNWERIS